MDIERFCIKFFARPGTAVDDAVFIDIFHEWIRFKQLGGILLDVADYRHVPQGPGIMLITHDINFAMDYADNRLGLFAQRKQGQGNNHRDRILELIQATLAFGVLLESDWRIAGKLSLEGGAFHYMSNDRLLAPNNTESFAAVQPDLTAAAAMIYPGQDIALTYQKNDPRDRLTVAIEANPIDFKALLETVGVTA